MSRNYEFTEKPAGAILGRRGFIKVVGFSAIVAGATGVGINSVITERNKVLLARQRGLYKDDKLCQAMKLTRSHENPVVKRIYSELGAQPMDRKMYGLLHTHYYHRSMLAANHG
jgi:hypothetical protein